MISTQINSATNSVLLDNIPPLECIFIGLKHKRALTCLPALLQEGGLGCSQMSMSASHGPNPEPLHHLASLESLLEKKNNKRSFSARQEQLGAGIRLSPLRV